MQSNLERPESASRRFKTVSDRDLLSAPIPAGIRPWTLPCTVGPQAIERRGHAWHQEHHDGHHCCNEVDPTAGRQRSLACQPNHSYSRRVRTTETNRNAGMRTTLDPGE